MFEEVFNIFYNKNEGIKAIGVWGKDGLELEKKYFADLADVDLEFSGAELADIISKLDNTRTSPPQFFMKLNYHNYHLRVFSLTPEYFLIILSEKYLIDGKLKFYLDIYKERLISSL